MGETVLSDGKMKQTPECGDYLLKWKGDALAVTLTLSAPRKGRAVFRTDVGGEWDDWPMDEVAPGAFAATLPLGRVGIFSGKCCFFPDGSPLPEWPQGSDFRVKVEPASTRFWFGLPLFEEARVKVAGGTFTVRAEGLSPECRYIRSIRLNGAPYDKPYIDYADIVAGGELVFTMGS